jgi:hypothetical protein
MSEEKINIGRNVVNRETNQICVVQAVFKTKIKEYYFAVPIIRSDDD